MSEEKKVDDNGAGAQAVRTMAAHLLLRVLLLAAAQLSDGGGATDHPHPPISFSYNGTSWCELGPPARHDNRASGFGNCAGSFTVQGDNWSTPSALVGEATWADEHGLRVQISWKHYTNASLGVAGSREWAAELRFTGNATAHASLSVCGPDDNFSPAPAPGPPTPAPPTPVCPAPTDVREGQCIQGFDLENCKPVPPASGRSSITPSGCSSTHASWAANATLGFESCVQACCDNPSCVASYYEQKSQEDGFGHCTTGDPSGACENRPFWGIFILNIIFLPRQARDKHRKS